MNPEAQETQWWTWVIQFDDIADEDDLTRLLNRRQRVIFVDVWEDPADDDQVSLEELRRDMDNGGV